MKPLSKTSCSRPIYYVYKSDRLHIKCVHIYVYGFYTIHDTTVVKSKKPTRKFGPLTRYSNSQTSYLLGENQMTSTLCSSILCRTHTQTHARARTHIHRYVCISPPPFYIGAYYLFEQFPTLCCITRWHLIFYSINSRHVYNILGITSNINIIVFYTFIRRPRETSTPYIAYHIT